MTLFDSVVLGILDGDAILPGAVIFENGGLDENIIAGGHGDGAAEVRQ